MSTADSDASEVIWHDFHRDENRVRITGENKVRLYFAQLGRTLAALQRAVEKRDGSTTAETAAVRGYARRLCQTFEALALRHFYPREGDELAIDTTDSGFAHFTALLSLEADLGRRQSELAAIPEVPELKERMLEQIVRYSLHPRDLQRALLRRLYLESLAPEKLFGAFVAGELVKVGAENDNESFFWSFATYDRSLNRPFVYLLYFAWDPGRTALCADSKEFEELIAAARHLASGRVNLLAFSNRLDEAVPRLRPRIVRRLAFGPYHAPAFTRSEGDFGQLLDRLAERLPFALHWETETLLSERETRVGAGWLSKGRLRQIFWIPKHAELAQRGVSQLERTVLLPHWLAQQVKREGLLGDHEHLLVEEHGEARELA